jgi:hypothetical protein
MPTMLEFVRVAAAITSAPKRRDEYSFTDSDELELFRLLAIS